MCVDAYVCMCVYVWWCFEVYDYACVLLHYVPKQGANPLEKRRVVQCIHALDYVWSRCHRRATTKRSYFRCSAWALSFTCRRKVASRPAGKILAYIPWIRQLLWYNSLIPLWSSDQTQHMIPACFVGIPYCHNQCPCPSDQPNVECYDPPGVMVPELPCPLLNNTTVVEQPINYSTLTERYVNVSVDFVVTSAAANRSFLLYLAFGHTHAWNFAKPSLWGKSRRGKYGDATIEVDAAIGEVANAVRAHAPNSLLVLSSDNGAATQHRFEHAGSNGPFRCGKGTAFEVGHNMYCYVCSILIPPYH